MGGIDPGTGALINRLANPPNPMQQLGQTIEGVSALRDFQAKQATADAYRQSVDPTTGQVDVGKFNALLSQNPAGAWNFGPAAQQAGQAIGQQGQGTSAQVKAAQDQLSTISGFLGPLYGDGKSPISVSDATAALERAKELHIATPEMINNFEQQLSGLGPNGDARNLINGAVFATGAGLEQLHLRGQPGYVDVGPGLARTAPAAAGSTPDYLPKGLNPENQLALQRYLAEPYDWTDKEGVEHRGGTKADWFAQQGINPFAVYGAGNMPTPGSAPSIPTTGPVGSVTTGRAPVAPAAPGGGVSPSGGGRGPAPPAPPPVAPPAGEPAAPSTAALPAATVKAGQDAYGRDLDMQGTLGTRVGPLESALSVLRANPNLQTVGQDELNQLTQLAHAFKLPIGDINNANAYQELGKYLAGYMRNLPGANRSDLASTEAAAASPHIGQGRGAMEDLLAKAVGYERLRAAGVDYFHSQFPDESTAAQNSGQYNIKTRKWLSTQDPVAYSVDQMTPQQYGEYYSGLSNSDKQKFVASRSEAMKLYPWLKVGGTPPAAAPAAAAPVGP
jgi:hypothetical protein